MSAPKFFNNVGEISTTTGSGTYALGGAFAGSRAFAGSGFVDGDTCCYHAMVVDASGNPTGDFENGKGTLGSSCTTLTRDTISDTYVAGVNGSAAVSWAAGTRRIFNVFPAEYTDLLAPTAEPILITGATPATIGRLHRCSGTAADYTVAIPTAVGNDKKRIAFEMAPIASLSKLVTLDPNGSETINGRATRILWADETCVLESDGANWRKVEGVSIPMYAQIQLGSTQGPGAAVPNATIFTVLLDTSVLDNMGTMVDTANNRLVCRRPGAYSAGLAVTYTGFQTPILEGRLVLNGALIDVGFANTAVPSAYGSAAFSGPVVLAAGDLVTLEGYQNSGGTSVQVVATLNQTYLALTEIPTW